MKFPARFVIGNLIWSRDNSVWAVYRVKPVSYPYLSEREKLQEHAKMRQAIMALPDQSMILSVCENLDPESVIHNMEVGIDPSNEVWHEAVEATFDAIDGIPLYQRLHYLIFKVPKEGNTADTKNAFNSAGSLVKSMFGLPPAPVSRAEIENYLRAARKIEARIRSSLLLKPVTAGEVRWLYARSITRGIFEPELNESWEPNIRKFGKGKKSMYASPTLANLGEAVFKEGGFKDDPERPKHKRYLRVESDYGVSYQTFMVVADMPHTFVFPNGGGEWFYHADALPFPVDWYARIKSIPNQDAQIKSRKQARQLVGQVAEYDGEPSGAPQSLAAAMESIDDQRAYLSSNPSEPEIQATFVYSIASDNLVELEENAAHLQSLYEPNEYTLPRPTGNQLHLFQGMLPGSLPPYVTRDYVQYLLCRDMAAGMPFGGAEVGDPRGMLLGALLDGGTFNPVLFDPAYGPAINRSGSLGAFGALGAGKSYFIKSVMWSTLARNGQIVTLDRTVSGEYVEFSKVAPGTSQVVRLIANSDICLDPLRVFGDDDRVKLTVGFLTMLTGTAPTELQGAVLAEAVRDAAMQPNASLKDVIDLLGQRADEDEDARVLWRKLKNFAQNELARLAFGDGKVLSLDADYIVFHAPSLSLPSKEVLLNEHLAKQLLPEQIFSQALLYLVAAVAKKVTFHDPDRFAAALFDEAWALTSSIQGRQLMLDGIRDGRKHNAAIWLLSQHPNDLGDDELAHLLGNRFVFKQSRGASKSALKFLGMDADEGWVEMLETGLESGQCLYRDVRDRIGLIQVLEAPTDALREAFDTNPETQKERRRQAAEAAKVAEVPDLSDQIAQMQAGEDFVNDDDDDVFAEPVEPPSAGKYGTKTVVHHDYEENQSVEAVDKEVEDEENDQRREFVANPVVEDLEDDDLDDLLMFDPNRRKAAG